MHQLERRIKLLSKASKESRTSELLKKFPKMLKTATEVLTRSPGLSSSCNIFRIGQEVGVVKISGYNLLDGIQRSHVPNLNPKQPVKEPKEMSTDTSDSGGCVHHRRKHHRSWSWTDTYFCFDALAVPRCFLLSRRGCWQQQPPSSI